MFPHDPLAAFLPSSGVEQLRENLMNEVIANRVRLRALLELLEERGLLPPGEFDRRAEALWQRDYAQLRAELDRAPTPEAEEELSARGGLAEKPNELLCLECGALCCKSSLIPLREEEVPRLQERARLLGIAGVEIVKEPEAGEPKRSRTVFGELSRTVLLAFPCPFLAPDDRCRIYEGRPEHCRSFPFEYRDYCLLSWKLYPQQRRAAQKEAKAAEPTRSGDDPEPAARG